jgi:hypothetical protein
LRAQLAEGERLAWASAPEADLLLAPKPPGVGKWDALVIVGGGYAVIGTAVMIVRTGHWSWLALPLALLVLGAAVYAIERWLEARKQKRVEGTVYGLTTRRALVLETFPALKFEALPISEISDIALGADLGDVADITLQPAGMMFRAVAEPERARNQLLRVIRDPAETEREIAASEAYALQMQKLVSGR